MDSPTNIATPKLNGLSAWGKVRANKLNQTLIYNMYLIVFTIINLLVIDLGNESLGNYGRFIACLQSSNDRCTEHIESANHLQSFVVLYNASIHPKRSRRCFEIGENKWRHRYDKLLHRICGRTKRHNNGCCS